MPARVSEALVLRTYPLKEADLVVSFLTRDQGKLRGVAKRARRPKNPFGAGLERLSHVRMAYFQRETRELVNLDSCELIRSQFGLVSDYWAGVALDYFAEVSEQLLPAAEPNERFFRLLLAVLDDLQPTSQGVAGGDVLFVVGAAAFRMDARNGKRPEVESGLQGDCPGDAAYPGGAAFEDGLGPGEPRRICAASWCGRSKSHIERRLVTAPLLEEVSS